MISDIPEAMFDCVFYKRLYKHRRNQNVFELQVINSDLVIEQTGKAHLLQLQIIMQ
ncbi:hypothetical protein D3C73_1006250 [compost metagenome]